MAAYYNEIDPYAAQWLRNLIAAGHIAAGEVDERSIEDVRPDDLRGFTQCHFFAGIGGWPLALRRAGWPDDRSVWSGSAPCQPFSQAGEGLGFADERHLWPYFHWLIAQRLPSAVVGEQVASKDVDPWIDLVQSDMEAVGYAFGSVPFPSAGVGAPHIRDRNFWVAYSDYARPQGRRRVHQRSVKRPARASGLAVVVADTDIGFGGQGRQVNRRGDPGGDALERARPSGGGVSGELAHSDGRDAGSERQQRSGEQRQQPTNYCVSELGHADSAYQRGLCSGQRSTPGCPEGEIRGQDWQRHGHVVDRAGADASDAAGPTNGFWRTADWLFCRDEKWRPVEPGTFPLVDGLPAGMGKLSAEQRRLAELAGLDASSLKRAKAHRVGSLRGYGNAINVEAATEFIRAAREAIEQ